ncbi:isoleucine--tRNA ligase [Candidatus Parcubacteria bacterium]|nr:isoleucine--tRNA ligase [Candidatus Parcubacteria bacterium]
MKKQKNTENKVKKNPFSLMEEDVLKFWENNKIFEKSVEREAPNGDYVFYDGPPFATGTPHYGHLAGSIMKDVIPRYWTMRGYRVERRWGWDCHGLPIENIVEKEMGSKSKKDIEEIGVEKFNEMCRSKVLDYVDEWKKTIKRLGRWADMENCYKTMDLDFMESVWWVFKELYDKGLIYEGYRSMHICPRCETTLSQSEVAEGYRDIKDLSVVAKFELEDEPGTYVLAWTTTPWTLIGNVALAVGHDISYAKIKIDNKFYYIAKDCLINTLKQRNVHEAIKFDGAEISSVKGIDLVGKKYKPIFDYYEKDEKLENRENGWKIYGADFVNTEEGTGVVHIAPAFGDDDMNLGKEHNLPFIQHVGMDGIIKDEAKDFKGMNVKPIGDHQKTDIEIIKYLAHNNLLFFKKKFEHSYPHCWRCDMPLINYATSSWFVNVLKIKDKMLETAKEINWSPAHIKDGRFGNWLEGARDWSISRQRFWASVMPIWKCEKCGKLEVFGSVKELENARRNRALPCSGAICADDEKITDLHKHIVDKITFKCEKCDGEMRRIPDVLDTWFDSGSMPYAQMHYPFENKEKFEKNFPAEFIAEGVDQTRCWFYYLHVISNGIKEKHAYKNVIVNGIVLAEDGKKMAKKLQNYPDPSYIFEKYSADALRYYLLSSPVMLAENLNFSEDGVKESLRKNVMLLWNVCKFYGLFAGDVVETKNFSSVQSDNILDKWIIARLNQLVCEVSENMDKYNLPKATRPISEFINDLSTWYIRRSRNRFKGGDENDKAQALKTTKHVLMNFSKIIAPVMPFIAEQVWQKVTGFNFENKDKSVHLEGWPNAGKIDKNIIAEMEATRKIVELGLAKRDETGIKVRQPLSKLKVKSEKLKVEKEYIDLIKDELNVKTVETHCNASDKESELKVELDTKLTPELKQEGIKREIVRTINSMRKNAGLTISNRIVLFWQSENQDIIKAIKKYQKDICDDVLADEIKNEKNDEIDIQKEIDLDGGILFLCVQKI